jgi:hypothetical protein
MFANALPNGRTYVRQADEIDTMTVGANEVAA